MKKILTVVLFGAFLSGCGGSDSNSINDGDNSSATSQVPNTNPYIDINYVADGGPGLDGIPSLDNPRFEPVQENSFIQPEELVVGVKIGNVVKAYPHRILNWHEVVNDALGDTRIVLSYCPLTGSAMAWDSGDEAAGDTEFGVSGLLYNSNLIMYDRNTLSLWPQMLMLSSDGPKAGTEANAIAVFETTWETFKAMYPMGEVLTAFTGFSRDYRGYPYGDYLTSAGLFFDVSHVDQREHPKTRVLGVRVGDSSMAYRIEGFDADVQVINDTLGDEPIAVIGGSTSNFAVAFNRTLADGTVVELMPAYNQMPIVATDAEGNHWDISGKAVAGPRTGESLGIPFNYVAFWFAWVAFFPDTGANF